MKILSENVLDKYNKNGTPCFKVSMDETFNEVSINPECHEIISERIFEAFNNLGFSKECIKDAAVIGSTITPLSTNKSVIDVAVVTENNKLFDEIRKKLYSDGIIDSLIRSNSKLSSIDFSFIPDESTMKVLIYTLRPHILKDYNKKNISENTKMKVYFIIEPDASFLEGENHFKIISNGKRVAQYVPNKKVGYVEFLKDVNKKQYYKYVIKPLFNMFKDYKIVINSISNNGNLSEEYDENLVRLKVSYDIMKNNRFNGKTSILWKDHNGEPIKLGYNKKPLDYSGTYSYMNILYHHVSSDLISPYGSELTLKNLFNAINELDEGELKKFGELSKEYFGKFAAGSFLTEKFTEFQK